MTTNNEFVIEVHPSNLEDLAKKTRNVRPGFRNFTEDRLDSLGRKLVPIVKSNTPKSSGRLARSSRYRIIRKVDNEQVVEYELQIIQDAVAKAIEVTTGAPRKARVSERYFYWYTVHHGLAPAGRLSNAFPPPESLQSWVMKTLGVTREDSYLVALRVARKIHERGIKPNTYLLDSLKENIDLLQETADEIGKSIVLDLSRLPDIVLPGSLTTDDK